LKAEHWTGHNYHKCEGRDRINAIMDQRSWPPERPGSEAIRRCHDREKKPRTRQGLQGEEVVSWLYAKLGQRVPAKRRGYHLFQPLLEAHASKQDGEENHPDRHRTADQWADLCLVRPVVAIHEILGKSACHIGVKAIFNLNASSLLQVQK
jgi:hypothetical protein